MAESADHFEAARRSSISLMIELNHLRIGLEIDEFAEAVRLFDECLEHDDVGVHRLNDTALCCLFITWKLATQNFGKTAASEFSGLTGGAISAQTLVSIEVGIDRNGSLRRISRTSPISISSFIYKSCLGLAENDYHAQVMFLSRYLWELAWLDKHVLAKFSHNVIGAAISFVACYTISPSFKPWIERLRGLCFQEAINLKPCVLVILDLQQKKRGTDEESEKVRFFYSRAEVGKVANIPLAREIPPYYFQ